MSWTCPVCSRIFRTTHQPHSCEVYDADRHFVNRPPQLKTIYEKLLQEISHFGPFQVAHLKNAIIISANSSFLAIKARPGHIDLEFLLEEEMPEFPVYKVFRVSKRRVAHFVVVDRIENIDDELINLLHKAYNTVNNI